MPPTVVDLTGSDTPPNEAMLVANLSPSVSPFWTSVIPDSMYMLPDPIFMPPNPIADPTMNEGGGGAAGRKEKKKHRKSPPEHNPLLAVDISKIPECKYERWMKKMGPKSVQISTDLEGVYYYGFCSMPVELAKSVLVYIKSFGSPWDAIFEHVLYDHKSHDPKGGFYQDDVDVFCTIRQYKAAFCAISGHAYILVKKKKFVYLLDPHNQDPPDIFQILKGQFEKCGRVLKFVQRKPEQGPEGSCGVVVLARIMYIVWKTRKGNERMDEFIHRKVPCAFARLTAGIVKRCLEEESKTTKFLKSERKKALAEASEIDDHDVAVFWKRRETDVQEGNEISIADSFKDVGGINYFPLDWYEPYLKHKNKKMTAASIGVTYRLFKELMKNTRYRYKKLFDIKLAKKRVSSFFGY